MTISDRNLLHFLDIFFIVFHSSFSIFNSLGWAWKKTRRLHLATVTATLFSWFVLGIWHGWGYCFCTDWHWQVRDALGKPVTSWSYLHFLIKELTGIHLDPVLVDTTALAVLSAAVLLTISLNVKDFIERKKPKNSELSR